MGEYRLIHGDCLVELCNLPANSVDAIATDPPYELAFMGKSWDAQGVSFQPETWSACLRVLKPGGHMLCFGGSRTFHRIAVAIEDAGFELRDTIMWVYGSGFPKSHDVSKAIDKAAGAERVKRPNPLAKKQTASINTNDYGDYAAVDFITPEAAIPDAAKWQGWGTALKPAFEPIILARKPLEGTVAANVLKWGTGAINVDGCRVGTDEVFVHHNVQSGNGIYGEYGSFENRPHQGRWPANFIHDGSEEVLELMPNDSARFYYSPKASKQDRDQGCEGLEEKDSGVWDGRASQQESRCIGNTMPGPCRNNHPTVKPTSLMRYLCKLITPPNGTILDPFMGSGSTGKAAMLEGFNFIGIEREQKYVEIAEARIGATTGASVAVIEEQSQIPGQLTLF